MSQDHEAPEHDPTVDLNTPYAQPCAACGTVDSMPNSGRLCKSHSRLWDLFSAVGIRQVVKWAENFPYGYVACARLDTGDWTAADAIAFLGRMADTTPAIYKEHGAEVSTRIPPHPWWETIQQAAQREAQREAQRKARANT